MLKFDSADNQHGQALAYIIGIYFGDGHISVRNNRYMFEFSTIDEDFADFVEENLKTIGVVKYNRKIKVKKEEHQSYSKKPLHYIGTVHYPFFEELYQITHKKSIIPSIIYEKEEYKIKFLQGFIDSDGWININLSPNNSTIRLQIGVGKCGEYIYDIKRMFDKMGIITQKIQTNKTKNGKVYKRIRFNPKSFIESDFTFNIKRKKERLDAYKKAIEVFGSKGVKASFNDYKRELIELAKR